MFVDFVNGYEKKFNGGITNVEFGNKVYEWRLRTCITYNKKGKEDV